MRDEPFYRTLMNYINVAGVIVGLSASGRLATSLMPTGSILQMQGVSVQGFTTTNGTKAFDNTPFTSSQGSGFGLSVDLKPINSSNQIYVQGDFYGGNDTGPQNSWGLFLAGSSSAIVAGGENSFGLAGTTGPMGFTWKATTVSAATTTYAVRLAGIGGTFTLNGTGGAGLYANSMVSSLTVWEVQS